MQYKNDEIKNGTNLINVMEDFMNISTPSLQDKSIFMNKIHAMITLPVYSTYAQLPKISRVRRRSVVPLVSKINQYRQNLDGDYGPYINAV